jgi:hypothetical protein
MPKKKKQKSPAKQLSRLHHSLRGPEDRLDKGEYSRPFPPSLRRTAQKASGLVSAVIRPPIMGIVLASANARQVKVKTFAANDPTDRPKQIRWPYHQGRAAGIGYPHSGRREQDV